MSGLELGNVIKRYGATQVIHGVDLTIDHGEFCVFVGPSGCGKSTLLRLIAGLEPPSDGWVEIGGAPPDKTLRAGRLSMAFQDPSLLPWRTVRGNIELALRLARRPADAQDVEDYQTIWARRSGAVAAPTASLHFDAPLMAALQAAGLDRVTGDHMGMLATVMNALAMRDALERSNIVSCVMSAIPMSGIVDHYDRRKAIRALQRGEVVIFSAGTGNPFFTTDSAACLRAIEVGAELVLKATKVDGVYNVDPLKDKDAVKYDELSYDEALDKKLGVMDLTAICLCRDQDMPLRVFAMEKSGALLNIVVGGDEGTLVHGAKGRGKRGAKRGK